MISERAIRRSSSLLSASRSGGSWPSGSPAPADARSNRNARARGGGHRAEQSRPAGQPRLAVVSLGDQRVTIYDADGPSCRARSRPAPRPTTRPPGIYAVLQKNREHYSNRYDDAAMPFMQRITWTGIALHGGALPGYPGLAWLRASARGLRQQAVRHDQARHARCHLAQQHGALAHLASGAVQAEAVPRQRRRADAGGRADARPDRRGQGHPL